MSAPAVPARAAGLPLLHRSRFINREFLPIDFFAVNSAIAFPAATLRGCHRQKQSQSFHLNQSLPGFRADPCRQMPWSGRPDPCYSRPYIEQGGTRRAVYKFKRRLHVSFGMYMVGYVVLIVGLALGSHLLHIPPRWIGVGVICMIGIGILTGVTTTRHRDPPT